MFRPGTTLPVFPTRYGPIGVQICYDFWFNPELTRILALKGARLVVNCCATFQGEGKRDYMVHTTRTRAQENLIYTASANLLGGPGHQDYSAAASRRRSAPPTTSGTAPSPGPRSRASARLRGGGRLRGDRRARPSASRSSTAGSRSSRCATGARAVELDRVAARSPTSSRSSPTPDRRSSRACVTAVSSRPLERHLLRIGGRSSTSSRRLTAASSWSISSLERPSSSRSRSRA